MGPSRVACSYKDCKGVFGTESDMIAHKVHSPEHWYCKKCNLDTDCEETLLAHKILSPRHIVCPTCGMEFKSDGGRNIHVAQVSFEGPLIYVSEVARADRSYHIHRHIELNRESSVQVVTKSLRALEL